MRGLGGVSVIRVVSGDGGGLKRERKLKVVGCREDIWY